tara:strand:- start:123 stop:2036 length:1914 start_codon:yes stop_codon:yes gene_type:complete
MQRDTVRQKVFSRRALIFSGGAAALTTVLVGRLYYLQVVSADRYRVLADENRISWRLLPPPRGRILDRYGVELANNQQNYRILLIPEQTPNVEQTLMGLRELVSLEEQDYHRVLRDTGRKASFMPVMVLENLSWEQFSQINVNMPDLPGVQPDVGESRFYPYRESLAHLVGYVGPVAPKEQTGEPLLELPGFRTGKSGIERAREKALRGKAGNSQVEVNAYGRAIRELKREDGVPGRDIRLSIDMELQRFAYERLRGEAGSVVIVDVHTGEVLAMVSAPSFDPNAFNLGLDLNQWQTLIQHPRTPLVYRAISGQYAPGSTFKMIVALAALEAGVISADHRVFCSGRIKFGDRFFHCWKKDGHGELSLVNAIEQSCDVHFYDVARRTGIDRIGRMANRFGLGTPTGIELEGEEEGLVPTRAWKRKRRDQPWQQGETLVSGIGQGYLLVTPLQLAVMSAQIANGGFRVKPTLILADPKAVVRQDIEDKLEGGDHQISVPQVSIGLSTASLALVRRAMDMVSNSPYGTAYRSRIVDPAMAIAGKTGTVQVRRITKVERESRLLKNHERPWKFRDHALFVGYAPVKKPRYAVSVVIEHGGGCASVAAPVARDVLEEVQIRDRRHISLAGELSVGRKKHIDI